VVDQGRRGGEGDEEHPADINIALMNDSSHFDKLGISTREVLKNGDKWNFLPLFRLSAFTWMVCDPFFPRKAEESLTHRRSSWRAGRINDANGTVLCAHAREEEIHRKRGVMGSRILMLASPSRRTYPTSATPHVLDIIGELRNSAAKIDVWEPVAECRRGETEYGPIITQAGEDATTR